MIGKIWKYLDESEREIVTQFVCLPPPVSLDTLSLLSGASAIAVLNLMEKLKKKEVVFEKKGLKKGLYFPYDENLIDIIVLEVPDELMKTTIRKTIDYLDKLLIAEDERTIALAKLYLYTDDFDEGVEIVKNAADILRLSGRKAKAASYYDRILSCLSKDRLMPARANLFVHVAMGKIQIMMHRMPVQEQISLLRKAEGIAEEQGMWDCLPQVKLWLGKALQDAGQHKMAARHINDFLRLSERIGDKAMLKHTSHWVSEYFTWNGRFSEAIRRYEEMVGDLEEFGNDEMSLMSGQVVGLSYAMCGRVSRGLGMVEAVRVKAQMLNLQEVVNYCDQTSLVILIEVRKISEAEIYFNRLSAFSDDELGPFLTWILCDHGAYILCSKQDYKGAFGYLKKKAFLSQSMGRSQSPFPSTFETLSILESKGFVDEDINIDSLIDEVLNWDDIFMKGLALRYRALRSMEREQHNEQVVSDLQESERCLKRSGARIELARTRIALGKLYLSAGKPKIAEQFLFNAWEFFATIDSNLFPADLLYLMPEEHKVKLMVERMTKINESLGTLRDMSSFLEKVIDITMDFAMAMRGAFVVRDNDHLRIIASRNLDPALFSTEKFKHATDMIIRSIHKSWELIIPLPGNSKVSSNGKLSLNKDPLICMPAVLGEEVMGYLILDGRFGNEPFPESLIPFLHMLCSQIAVGLANIRTYEQLRQQRDRFEDEAVFYKREMGIEEPVISMVGSSEKMNYVVDQIRQVAVTDSSVLISGETGVGKELVAKAIHALSKRKNGPFIPVNLAALPQELIASELFGHEKGAFTGAHETKKGRFELADGGTIFLDEIGDLSVDVQVKLLRVLQDSTFERIGSTRPIRSNFRVIAATNKDLINGIEGGSFRQDLYYRLNVFPINVPSLRERRSDIPQLARYFANKYAKTFGKKLHPISRQEMNKLMDYEWPGNIRELEHFIERSVILADNREIVFPELKQKLNRYENNGVRGAGDKSIAGHSLASVERDHITRVLESTKWRISGPDGAAGILGLKASTLRFRMAKLGIERPKKRTAS